jgi:prophage maintenance system killer protein
MLIGGACYDANMAKELVPAEARSVFILPEDGVHIDVRIGSETVWLTQRQMAELFDTSSDNIGVHIKNTFADGELAEKATTEDFSVVQTEGRRKVRRDLKHYNLDAIISVGYRVNSKRGVTFRQWATRLIREQLVDDYKQRAKESLQILAGLKNIELLAHGAAVSNPAGVPEVLALIEKYARSWHLLLQYDEKRLPAPSEEPSKRIARLTPRQAAKIIDQFRRSLARKGQATDLFGRDRSDGLASILGNLEQTWGGQPVYPNVETRAAHLLYFVIKNHPFLDGNKRIGSPLFLHYLEKNDRPLLDESGLVALALLVAESDPKQKDVVVRLTISLMQEATMPTSSLETH